MKAEKKFKSFESADIISWVMLMTDTPPSVPLSLSPTLSISHPVSADENHEKQQRTWLLGIYYDLFCEQRRRWVMSSSHSFLTLGFLEEGRAEWEIKRDDIICRRGLGIFWCDLCFENEINHRGIFMKIYVLLLVRVGRFCSAVEPRRISQARVCW